MAEPRKKEVPMQVLSLGMSRTGTASIKAALQILGHKNVHHGYELYPHPEQADEWTRAWNSKIGKSATPFTNADWDALLGPYSAVTDMPAVCFAPELLAAYPDAKVILASRDTEKWYQSFKTGVIDTFWDNCRTTGVLSIVEPELMRPIHTFWDTVFAKKDGYFQASTREEMEQNSRGVYEKHNATVRRVAKEQGRQMLEFQVEDGWEPFCRFLGVEVPDVPFPRVNEGDAVKEVVGEYVKRSMRKMMRNVGVGVAVLGVAIWMVLK